MKYLSKKLAIVAAFVTMAFTQTAFSAQDVVMDNRGQYVHSFSGTCVRTNWEVRSDKCQKATASAYRAPSVLSKLQQVSRSFLVFFDFDKSSLTGDAKQVVSDIYALTKNKKSPRLTVIGHTDRSGSDQYNVGLSKRRANSVEAELKRLGISGSAIVTDWKGESSPLVSTEDGVKEPQNRRAEVTIEYLK